MLMLVGSSGGGLLLRPWLSEHGRLFLPAAKVTPANCRAALVCDAVATIERWLASTDWDQNAAQPMRRAQIVRASREYFMAGAGVHEVNDSSFEKEVLQSEQPVLVDFWAAWCGPCKALAPIVDEVANDFHGQLKVMKMDVDRNSATPMRYGIRGIPALLIFKDGKLADQIVGYVPKDTIAKSVSKVVAQQQA